MATRVWLAAAGANVVQVRQTGQQDVEGRVRRRVALNLNLDGDRNSNTSTAAQPSFLVRAASQLAAGREEVGVGLRHEAAHGAFACLRVLHARLDADGEDSVRGRDTRLVLGSVAAVQHDGLRSVCMVAWGARGRSSRRLFRPRRGRRGP